MPSISDRYDNPRINKSKNNTDRLYKNSFAIFFKSLIVICFKPVSNLIEIVKNLYKKDDKNVVKSNPNREKNNINNQQPTKPKDLSATPKEEKRVDEKTKEKVEEKTEEKIESKKVLSYNKTYTAKDIITISPEKFKKLLSITPDKFKEGFKNSSSVDSQGNIEFSTREGFEFFAIANAVNENPLLKYDDIRFFDSTDEIFPLLANKGKLILEDRDIASIIISKKEMHRILLLETSETFNSKQINFMKMPRKMFDAFEKRMKNEKKEFVKSKQEEMNKLDPSDKKGRKDIRKEIKEGEASFYCYTELGTSKGGKYVYVGHNLGDYFYNGSPTLKFLKNAFTFPELVIGKYEQKEKIKPDEPIVKREKTPRIIGNNSTTYTPKDNIVISKEKFQEISKAVPAEKRSGIDKLVTTNSEGNIEFSTREGFEFFAKASEVIENPFAKFTELKYFDSTDEIFPLFEGKGKPILESRNVASVLVNRDILQEVLVKEAVEVLGDRQAHVITLPEKEFSKFKRRMLGAQANYNSDMEEEISKLAKSDTEGRDKLQKEMEEAQEAFTCYTELGTSRNGSYIYMGHTLKHYADQSKRVFYYIRKPFSFVM